MTNYYYILPGATLTPAQQAAVARAGAEVVTTAPPTALPASGMMWRETTPEVVNGVLTQQWQQVAAPAVTPRQTAAAILSAGCAVVSTSTPTLSGTYPLDAYAVQNLTALVAAISANQGLPNGASTVEILDVAGTPHTFTATQLVALGAALRNVFYTCEMVAAGQSTTPPTQPAVIP